MAPGLCLKLNSGHTIPTLGFGTFYIPKDVVAKSIQDAFDAGYRHFDCAMTYENEKEVGEGIAKALKKHGLKREDIFVTSKLWCDKHDPKDVRKACEESVRNLGVDYLDLYLVHFPVPFHFKEGRNRYSDDPDDFVLEYHKLEDTWNAMEELIPAGLVKSIGVSNHSSRQIERIIEHGKIVPAVNQVEVNLHWLNTKLIDFCRSKNIIIEAYSVLGNPGFNKNQEKPILELEPVVKIAKDHNVTPAQVLIRHALQRNIVVLAKSVTPERIRSNYDVMGFELSEGEMNQLNNCGLNKRPAWPAFASHPDYPFNEDF
ncbi:hypothetical protein Aperf_G00000012370 [Anoplocephala perfoliata]